MASKADHGRRHRGTGNPEPGELFAEVRRRYREVDQRRKQAQQSLNDVQQFIATPLQLVEPGSWTAHDDLAELADTTPNEVADFLASGKVTLPTSYRVLRGSRTWPAACRPQPGGRSA
jgi:5-methylcytosine-specific restriction enzyme B